jgi:surface polysaccharide O-acyltransferase-like enzyme
MNNYISEKIKLLSAVAIVLVLYIHSGFHNDEISGMTINHYVQEMISALVGRCAVPLFYIISGYLFFYKVPDGLKSIYVKIRSRVNTLVVPYIITSLFYVAFLLTLDSIPAISKFINGSILPLFKQTWLKVLFSIFYDTGNGYPLPFHLWFLRDLLILVIFSPLWYMFLKRLKWWWVLAVFVLNYANISYFPIYALFWFSLGGILTEYDIALRSPKLGFLLLSMFLVLCLLQLINPDLLLWQYVKILNILLGIVSAWLVYDAVVPQAFSLQQHTWLKKICDFTFFIYLFHEPALNVVRKLIAYVLGKNEIGYLASYLLSPWFFIVFAILIGSLIKKLTPIIYMVAVGGR